jgi:hypothetical protein
VLSEVIAAGSDSGVGIDLSNPFAYLFNLGVLGVFTVLWILGKIVPENTVKNLMEQIRRKDEVIDAKDELIRELQNGVIHDALPALNKSTEAINQMKDTGKSILDGLNELKARVDNLFNAVVAWLGGHRS